MLTSNEQSDLETTFVMSAVKATLYEDKLLRRVRYVMAIFCCILTFFRILYC